jgi:GxxExxY protein
MDHQSTALGTLTGQTIGAAIEVHRALGPGYLESIYEEALCVELACRGVPFARQVPLDITYKSCTVGQSRLDVLVADQLIVELKAVSHVLPIHLATVVSYLKAFRQPVGLLINFHVPVLRDGVRRVMLGSLAGVGSGKQGDTEWEEAEESDPSSSLG